MKKKLGKQILSIGLALAMVLTTVPTMAFGEVKETTPPAVAEKEPVIEKPFVDEEPLAKTETVTEDEKEEIQDISNYDKVVALFEALPNAADLTDENFEAYKEQLDAASAAYDTLTEDEQTQFDDEHAELLVKVLDLTDAVNGQSVNVMFTMEDVSSGILLKAETAPKEETVYSAGTGTVTWTPTVTDGVITHGQLTLDGATFTVNEAETGLSCAINYQIVGSDLQILLKGENKIETLGLKDKAISIAGLQAIEGEIKGINGGSLVVDSKYDFTGQDHATIAATPLTFTDADVTVNNDAIQCVDAINFDNTKFTLTSTNDIYALSAAGTGDINVKDSTINVTSATKAAFVSYKAMNIENSTVIANAGAEYGIAAMSGLKVTKSSDVKAEGRYAYYIGGTGIDLQDSSLTAKGITTNASNYGIYLTGGGIRVKNSTFNATGVPSTGSNYGVYLTAGKMEITDSSTVTVAGKYGIYAKVNGLLVDSSTLNAECNVQDGTGIYVLTGGLSINNSTVTAESDEKGSYGIRKFAGPFTITNSEVTADANGYGISIKDDGMIVNNSTVTAHGVSKAAIECLYSGITAENKSTVTATSNGNAGIWNNMTSNETIVTGNSILTAKGNSSSYSGFYNGKITASDGGGVWSENSAKVDIYGTISASPETSSKTYNVMENAAFTMENDESFNTTLANGAVLTASNVKNLTSTGTNEIRLNDTVETINITGDVTAENNINVTHSNAKALQEGFVILTAKNKEDIVKFNYDINYFAAKDNMIAVPLPIEASVQWTRLSQVYDGTAKMPEISLTGVDESDKDKVNVSIKDIGNGKILAGTYVLAAELSGTEADKYFIANPTATFIIQKAPVVFTVADNSIAYDGSNKEATVTAAALGSDFTAFDITYKQGDVEVTPNAAGTYDIYAAISEINYRHTDSSDGNARKIGVLTIYETVKPTEYTVTFNANGGSGDVTALAAAQAGTVRVLPANTFTAPKGMIFAGWKYGSKTYQPGDTLLQTESNMVVTAAWKYNYNITGTVTQGGADNKIEGAVVTLTLGSEEIAQAVTNADGQYQFTYLYHWQNRLC